MYTFYSKSPNLHWFFSILLRLIFRKNDFIRRHTIAQNEFWTNVRRLLHSRRKGHCFTPKRCLDWWCNAPFFCAYAKRCFYGISDDFSFFVVPLSRKRKAVCYRSSHKWNKPLPTADKPGRMIVSTRPNKFCRIRKQSYFPCCGLPFSRFRWCLFLFGGFLFLRIFFWSFFYPICLCFRLPPSCAFHGVASGSHFRSGRKGNSGIGRESKVKPPVFWKNLQPYGSYFSEKPCIP